MTTAPIAIICLNCEISSKFMPLRTMVMRMAPSKLPQIEPRPPNKEVPPKMTAAIASNSNICAILPLLESMRAINTIAPKAQLKPDTTYTASL